jgi:GH25 family lysozyme M1 (1,4-beta-N-acetylmuramidase)
MLRGIDVSHHNKLIQLSGIDFVIMKATEGRSYVDPKMLEWYKQCKKDNVRLKGFYHFARPENNSPKTEANHFIKTVKDYIDDTTLVALDWEGHALYQSLDWALTWLNEVEEALRITPLFYCQSSYTPLIRRIYENGNGLWVAHYTGANKPIIGAYPFWTMWQYTSRVYDKNYFNGDANQYIKYCRS